MTLDIGQRAANLRCPTPLCRLFTDDTCWPFGTVYIGHNTEWVSKMEPRKAYPSILCYSLPHALYFYFVCYWATLHQCVIQLKTISAACRKAHKQMMLDTGLMSRNTLETYDVHQLSYPSVQQPVWTTQSGILGLNTLNTTQSINIETKAFNLHHA